MYVPTLRGFAFSWNGREEVLGDQKPDRETDEDDEDGDKHRHQRIIDDPPPERLRTAA